jgi:hypothetical protein
MIASQNDTAAKRRRVNPGTPKTPFQSPTLPKKSESKVSAIGGYDGMRESDSLGDPPINPDMSKSEILHQHLTRILAPAPKGRFLCSALNVRFSLSLQLLPLESFGGTALQPWIEQDDSMEPGPSSVFIF